ncbi:holo-ACP synthase [Metallumcola ferriviriculae]|uniref:Holo-[acyl-carrier-protein] synthase n=1 Tax=Metallumcola ferriviriculae TaxID=3039180 RepID=A0AAU0UTC0_9FIRM|nr:holo-ACP synthase [Desulfitibacteraceae bacterium MK1]
METIGVDIIEIKRIAVLVDKWSGKFTKRIFTTEELSYCFTKKFPAPSLAARFAAKEAVLKAMGLGLGACKLKDIEVISHPSGKPELKLHEKAEEIAHSMGLVRWQISLSHSKSHAVAMVLAVGN